MEKATGKPVLTKTCVDAFAAYARYEEVDFTIHQYRESLLQEGESDNELLRRVLESIGRAKPVIKNSLITATKSSEMPGLPKQMADDIEIHKLWCTLKLEDLDLLDTKITQMLMSKGDEVRVLSDALSSYYDNLGIDQDFSDYIEDEENFADEEEEEEEEDPFEAYAESEEDDDDEDAPKIFVQNQDGDYELRKAKVDGEGDVVIIRSEPEETEDEEEYEEEVEGIKDEAEEYEEEVEETEEEEPEPEEEEETNEEEVIDPSQSKQDELLLKMDATINMLNQRLDELTMDNMRLQKDNALLMAQLTKPKEPSPEDIMKKVKKSSSVREIDTPAPEIPGMAAAIETEDEGPAADEGIAGKASEVISKAKGAVRKTATKSKGKRKSTKRKAAKKTSVKKESETVTEETPKEGSE